MATVLRWTITDPYDTNTQTRVYTFPRNPAEMSSIYPDRSISSFTTLHGRVLFYEGTTPAKQFTFAGPVMEKAHFDALREWVYKRKRRVIIRDHFGRKITCVLSSVELVPKRRVNKYYSHDYTVTGLVVSITEPTITDAGFLG